MQSSKLGELVNITIGRTPSRSNSDYWDRDRQTENVWLSIADLVNIDGRVVNDSKEYIADVAASTFSTVPKGTLLVSFKLTLGRLAFAGRDLRTNEAIAALRNDESRVLNDYLYYFLSHFDWMSYASADKKVKGYTLNKAKLNEIEIYYPVSLEEQRRLVKKLDTAFEKIDRAIESARRNIDNSEILFRKLIDDQIKGNQQYLKVRLGSVCNFVRGPFGGSLKKDSFTSSGYAVYEQRHAIYNNFSNIRYFIDEEKFNAMKRFEVYPNDLIMSCSGTIGKVAVAPEWVKPGIINQALLKFSPNQENLRTKYLSSWIESSVFQDMLSVNTGGAAIKNVASVKILKELPISVPPISVQEQVIERIDKLKNQYVSLSVIQQKKLSYLIGLKQSMLHESFAESTVK